MRKFAFNLVAIVTSVTLAAPALAATAPAPVAVPPVTDGDMGCFVALGLIALDADKAATSDKLEQKDRDSMVSLAASMRSDARWYFGRISLLPPEQRSRAAFDAAFGRVDKGDSNAKFDTAMACSKWALAANTAMLNVWSGK